MPFMLDHHFFNGRYPVRNKVLLSPQLKEPIECCSVAVIKKLNEGAFSLIFIVISMVRGADCKVDLAFLLDGSWSIGKRRFKIQKDFLSEVAQAINVGVAGPMMGIIQYGYVPPFPRLTRKMFYVIK